VSVRELPYFIVKSIFGSQNGSMSYDRIESFVTHFMSFDVYRYSGPWAVGHGPMVEKISDHFL
jgi:hypothetical protein